MSNLGVADIFERRSRVEVDLGFVLRDLSGLSPALRVILRCARIDPD